MKNKTISESDFITNKILLVFSLALVGVFALMMVYRLILDPQSASSMSIALYVVAGLSAVGAGLGVKRWIREYKNDVDTSRKLVKGQTITLFCAIVVFCCLFIVFTNPAAAIRTLYILILGFAGLYLVKQIYTREFYVLSLICTFGALLLWGMSRVLAGGHMLLFPLCAALGVLSTIGMVIALQMAKKADGVCAIGRFSVVILDKWSEYGTAFFTLVLLTVLILVSLFIPAQIIAYFSYAVLGYLFIMAVYYTVKLM